MSEDKTKRGTADASSPTSMSLVGMNDDGVLG
jgi:hypothetical protein